MSNPSLSECLLSIYAYSLPFAYSLPSPARNSSGDWLTLLLLL